MGSAVQHHAVQPEVQELEVQTLPLEGCIQEARHNCDAVAASAQRCSGDGQLGNMATVLYHGPDMAATSVRYWWSLVGQQAQRLHRQAFS